MGVRQDQARVGTHQTLRFVVPGVAAKKGSTRAFIPKGWKRAVITNADPKAKAWQQLVSEHASQALAKSNLQPFADGPVLLDIWFYLPRPQKFLIPKYAGVDVPHTTAPDVDKLARLVIDSLTRVVYPDGAAAHADEMPLVELQPSPEFTKVAEASDAWTRRVDEPAELPRAIDAALTAVAGGRQALLDVRMEHGTR